MKPLGQAWGGRGQAQVGGRGSGRGGEVLPLLPPRRPQRAQLRGSRGGWRAIPGAQGPRFGRAGERKEVCCWCPRARARSEREEGARVRSAPSCLPGTRSPDL